MALEVKFHASDGIPLAGHLFVPEDRQELVPGIVLAHGFAAVHYPKMVAHLVDLGYAVLDFDFRGYGLSGGTRGHVIPQEQVLDLRGAISWLAQRPEVDSQRIGVIGSSLGGSVAIIEGADDDRVKVCIAGCPIAKGDSTFRLQHDTDEKFAAFLKSIEEKKRRNQPVPRWDIIYIPENLRPNLPPGIPMEFSADTVYGFLAMDPMEAVARLAPKPLLIIHATNDHVVPFEDGQALAYRAGKNCELDLVGALDHHIFLAEPVVRRMGEWLKANLPVNRRAGSSSHARAAQ